jgi:hypothetical protein
MFYKEWKNLAAHYVLKNLRGQKGYTIINQDRTERPPTYQWADIYKIKSKTSIWFSKQILNDAARMMFIGFKNPDNEVDMLNNENDPFKSEFKLLDKGLTAYKDGKYFRLFLKSWKTIIAILAAVVTFILGVIVGLQQIGVLCKCQ